MRTPVLDTQWLLHKETCLANGNMSMAQVQKTEVTQAADRGDGPNARVRLELDQLACMGLSKH